jgi:competence protein ComEA
VFDAPAAPDTGGGSTATGSSDALRATSGSPALSNQRIALAGVIGALAIGGLAVAIAVAGSGGETVEGPGVGLGAVGAVGSQEPESAIGEIIVDVAGAVVTPGVYHLPNGARVGDAINAAGGFNPRVDVDRVGAEINLAAALTDGSQVRVPSRDDAVPSGGSPDGGTGGVGGAGGNDGAGQPVNLNTASQSELETLSGIGPVTAGKILESRAGSPFKTVDELRERGLVGEKTFEKIRAQLTVR